MEIKKREIIYVIGEISDALYKVTTLTDMKKKYVRADIENVYAQMLIISGHIEDIKDELFKLSKEL